VSEFWRPMRALKIIISLFRSFSIRGMDSTQISFKQNSQDQFTSVKQCKWCNNLKFANYEAIPSSVEYNLRQS
jgi:hypothetical protein